MSTQRADNSPRVLGWHDSHGASVVALTGDGHIVYAAAEERFTKRKLQKGYPTQALDDFAQRYGDGPIEKCYTDLPLGRKMRRNAGLIWSTWRGRRNCAKSGTSLVSTLSRRMVRGRFSGITGTDEAPRGEFDTLCEHHTAHAASAYYLSGFDRAFIVTIDGVGDCLSGTVFEGVDGRLTQRKQFYYNELTVGADYEVFTAMLGFNPDRHCGKITGLAAYGAFLMAGTFFRELLAAGNAELFRSHPRD